MKIKVKNLGALKQAEFCINKMTIICGKNNTGKTYATYALYGFLSEWRNFINVNIDSSIIPTLLKDGVINIDLNNYKEQIEILIEKACQEYIEYLPSVFAAPEDRFKDSSFSIELSVDDITFDKEYTKNIRTSEIELFSFQKKEKNSFLTVTLLQNKENVKVSHDIISRKIKETISEILFGHLFPNPFIASAERTGAAIFRKELNFDRNRMMEEISKLDKKPDFFRLLSMAYVNDYASPVKANVDFTRNIESISKNNSFISVLHSEILTDFADIIGGAYTVTKSDELYYIPKSGKKIKLTMDESSSAIRSLLDVGFYLRHVAQYGDILIIDEPELNLHPENQRKIARLFARLVNIGIKVFITTHSDYIIKELSSLIMLKQEKAYIKKIIEKEGYKETELISADSLNIYMAEESRIVLDDTGKKSKVMTLLKSNVSQEKGIEASSFDSTIDDMNRIQDDILWGED